MKKWKDQKNLMYMSAYASGALFLINKFRHNLTSPPPSSLLCH
jgi:hypothetical protein